MFKNTIAALGFLLLGFSPAYAANVSPLSGPQDPSQLGAVVNTLIVSGNTSWNAAGASFLAANNISPIATAAITVTALGAGGISPATIIEWLKIRNPSGQYRFIPMWGCSPGC